MYLVKRFFLVASIVLVFFLPHTVSATTTPETFDEQRDVIFPTYDTQSVEFFSNTTNLQTEPALGFVETTVPLTPENTKDIWTTSYYSYDGVSATPGGGQDDEYLVAGGWGDSYYALMEFDIADLPDDVVSVRLDLYNASPRGRYAPGLYLDRITEFWDWRTQGTGRDRERLWWADRPSTTYIETLPAPAKDAAYSIDITELYRGWKSGLYPNYGLQIRPMNTWNVWAEFYSSDYVGSPELAPRLVITTEEDMSSECCASVLFLPGIQSSILSDGDNRLWPPTFGDVKTDLGKLALRDDGTPVTEDIVVEGIVEDFNVGPVSTAVYGDFVTHMDALVAGGIIGEWEPLGYDWRFSPEYILEHGIRTSATTTIDVIETLEQLAVDSKTGTVSIVAHSMGGLLGKVVIAKLIEQGKEDLVESFIMVGSPQRGTPKTIASLLHGYGMDISFGPFVYLNKAYPRALGQNLESAHNLLPSQSYFEEVADSLITFADGTLLTEDWRNQWGESVDSFNELFEFLSGRVLGLPVRSTPLFDDTQSPEVLREDLLSRADDLHSEYDNFVFPEHMRVVQVAGWGVPTLKGIRYTEDDDEIDYQPLFTEEGDGTVVYPSAVSGDGERYYFNLVEYNSLENIPDFQHRDLLGAVPVYELLKSILQNSDVEIDFITNTKPDVTNLTDRLLVSAHSPVTLGVYDAEGRFTGIKPNQDPSADVHFIANDIPQSEYIPFGEGQYILLPNEGTYTFKMNGTDTGTADVWIERISEDKITESTRYTDIVVTDMTEVAFTLEQSGENPTVVVDTDGDGVVDKVIRPDDEWVDPVEALSILRDVIGGLNVGKQLQKQLSKKVDILERKILFYLDSTPGHDNPTPINASLDDLSRTILRHRDEGALTEYDVVRILGILIEIENSL